MELLGTPRGKLLAASALALALALGAMGGGTAVGLARWLLGGAAVAGLGLWLRRSGARAERRRGPAMEVRARAGLGPRSGVALVRAEGRSFLITHGDGFARILPLPRKEKPRRRVRSRRSSYAKEVLQ
ncbi:MAG TPA: flagellar biosynthetic protein FliO [Myxococcaceae bacterium]|nr:flagellar biosynthetic protein FliO [Myxococcaceae bacterium]